MLMPVNHKLTMEWTRAEVWARLLQLQNFVPADCKLSPHRIARLIGGNGVCLTGVASG
jgi:hypothetical protein